MQPTFVDFEVTPPHDHGVRAELTGTEFGGDHYLVRPGDRVDLIGFAATARPGTDLTVTVRGCAEPTARNVPVLVSVNGEQVTVLHAAPGPDGPVESRITVPSALFSRGAEDGLSLRVAPGADGAFRLWHVLVDPADEEGRSERTRREIAEGGSLWPYLTRTGAPGAEDGEGTLWLQLGGTGRAALAALGWRMRDGERASVAFDATQRSFVGRRISGRNELPASYRGEVVGIRRMPRQLPRPHRTVVFDTQLRRDGDWRDAVPLTVHLDLDDGHVPLAELEWTDRSGARTGIALTPDGRGFFGHHQPAGREPVAYRGRIRGSADLPFPFETVPAPPAQPLGPEVERFATCPAKALSGGSLEADAVIAAARRSLAGAGPTTATGQRRTTGTALRHLLLAHGFATRPAVARAIVELVPEQAPLAVGQLARFLDDPANDPSARPGSYPEQAPDDHELLCTALALATLDGSYVDTAVQLYREAGPYTAAVLGADLGMLGPSQRQLASERLRNLAASTRAAQVATPVVRALVRLGQFELVLGAMRDFTDRGIFLSHVVRPLSEADPAVLPALVDSALRALAADPGSLLHLAVRGDDGPVADVVSEVLACGAAYRDRVTGILWELVRSVDFTADVRWRAAHRLGLIASSEREDAVRALEEGGVRDPEAPRPQRPAGTEEELAAAFEAATAVWQRIERELARRFPSFPVTLGAPATREEISACEQALGCPLPVEFAASCLVHRSIAFGDLVTGMPNQQDVAQLADYRGYLGREWSNDRPDAADALFHGEYGWRDGWVPLESDEPHNGAALDLDPAPAGRYGQILSMDHGMPQDVSAAGWFDLLERFATNLEQGRYLLHKDGYLDLTHG
ncbi:SMI1/KNR4 family protein [Kitasatospora sp. NPDC028055]|uniref:SMI1/KNR4 family protein n=1 Tax=Kitasatospora sp. NPDC028055 TaxID=3155653 RepID=UPI0033F2F1C4